VASHAPLPFTSGEVNRPRVLLWLALLAALVGGSVWFSQRSKAEDRELPVYVVGGERMAAGEEIYRRGSDAKPFTYPPFAAAPFVPFARLPAGWQPPIWFALNFGILLLLARWLHRYGTAALPGLGPPKCFWFQAFVLLVGGRHVASVLTNQSHDLLIAGCVGMTAAAWCRGRAAAGLGAGIGAAMKATPLLFAALFVLRLRWLPLLLLFGVVALLSLLPDWLFPRTDGRWWLEAWYAINLRGLEVGGTAAAEGAWNAHSILNQSLSGTLTRWFQPVVTPNASFVLGERGAVLVAALSPTMAKVVTLGASLLVLALIAIGVRAAHRFVAAAADKPTAQRLVGLGEVAAIACGMVLLSPQSSKAHFCIWLFPVAFCIDRLTRGRVDWLAWLLLLSGSLVGLLAKDLLGRELGNLLLGWGNVTWATVLFLAATVRCLAAPRLREQA
jgi:hypothetical protein